MSRATHVLQWAIQWVAKPQGGANPIKVVLSSDCRLKLACMKLESLVTVSQLYHGEYVLGSCTHRPSRHESWGCPKCPYGSEGKTSDWDEVVTRYPYGNVRMDHLLSKEKMF